MSEKAIAVLPGDSVAVAKAFYTRLGFTVAWEFSENGTDGLIGFERNGMEFTLDCPMSGHGRNACVTLRVADADRYYEEWKDRVNMKRAPVDEDWGARTFGITDPFGNTIFVIGPRTTARD